LANNKEWTNSANNKECNKTLNLANNKECKTWVECNKEANLECKVNNNNTEWTAKWKCNKVVCKDITKVVCNNKEWWDNNNKCKFLKDLGNNPQEISKLLETCYLVNLKTVMDNGAKLKSNFQ